MMLQQKRPMQLARCQSLLPPHRLILHHKKDQQKNQKKSQYNQRPTNVASHASIILPWPWISRLIASFSFHPPASVQKTNLPQKFLQFFFYHRNIPTRGVPYLLQVQLKLFVNGKISKSCHELPRQIYFYLQFIR